MKCLSYSIENYFSKKKKKKIKKFAGWEIFKQKVFTSLLSCTIMYYNLLNFTQIMIKLI